MSYHRGGQTGSVAVSYSTSPMAPHSPSRGYSSGSTSSSTTTSGVGGGGGGGGVGSTGTGSTTSTYNYTSRGTSLLRDRSSIFPTSTSLTIPSLRSSYVSDCKRSYCQTGSYYSLATTGTSTYRRSFLSEYSRSPVRSVSSSSSSSYSSDKKGIGGGFSSKLSNGISSGGTGSRYASSTSSSHLSSSTGSRDRILDTSPGSSSTLRRDVNTDHLIGRCSASTYVPNIRHSTGSHQRWKPQHSKAGSSSLNELIGGEEREGERTIRPDSSLSSSSSSSLSAITGGGLWSRSKERPPTGSTVLTTATGHARAHSTTSSVEVTIGSGQYRDDNNDDDEDDVEGDDDEDDIDETNDANDGEKDDVNEDNDEDDDNDEDNDEDNDDDDDEDDDRHNNNNNADVEHIERRSTNNPNEEDGCCAYEQIDYNNEPRDNDDNNRINRHLHHHHHLHHQQHHQHRQQQHATRPPTKILASKQQRISASPTVSRNSGDGGAGCLISVNLDLLTNLASTNPNNTELLIDNNGHQQPQQQQQQQRQQQQQQEPQVLLQLNEFEIDENEVIRGVGDVAPIEPVDTDREILEDLPNESPSANSFDIEDNDFVFGTLYPVLQNGLPGRTSDGHSDDPSLPSTSRRQDGHFSGVAGAVNTVSAGRSSPTTASTGYQSLYRAGIEFEGSPTNRPARSPYQPHRDERCGLNGLRNIGNTCFMNSVIQCLSNTRPLLEYVMNEQYLIDINTKTSSMKGALIKEFSQVIHELWQVDGDHVVNTTTLKTQIQRFTPRFLGYSQQDAQEFLRYLLEGLHEDVNRVVTKPQPIHTDIPDVYSDSEKAAESWKRYLRSEDSMIVDIFVGQLRSSLRCTHCNHVSVTLDPFWDLSLPIPARSGTVKLSQCLEHFTREEVLDGDEKPTCSKCQMRRKCTKSFSIQKFPKILVIHLKRFSPMERYRGKLNVVVDFPLMDLDLSAFAAPRVPGCTYNLYGVANHSGTTYSGHYTAYCKHPYSGEWHEYNDSHVSAIPARSVVSSEAYVLFYEQQPHSSHL